MLSLTDMDRHRKKRSMLLEKGTEGGEPYHPTPPPPPVADLDGGDVEEEGRIQNLVARAGYMWHVGQNYKGLHGCCAASREPVSAQFHG